MDVAWFSRRRGLVAVGDSVHDETSSLITCCLVALAGLVRWLLVDWRSSMVEDSSVVDRRDVGCGWSAKEPI